MTATTGGDLLSTIGTQLIGADELSDLRRVADTAKLLNERLQSDLQSGSIYGQSDLLFALAYAVLLDQRDALDASTQSPPARVEDLGSAVELAVLVEAAKYFRFAVGVYDAASLHQEQRLWPTMWPAPFAAKTPTEMLAEMRDKLTSASRSFVASIESARTPTAATTALLETTRADSTNRDAVSVGDGPAPTMPVAVSEWDPFTQSLCDALGVANRSNMLLSQPAATRFLPAFFVLQVEDELVIAIRGTQSVADVVSDALLSTYNDPVFGPVHTGIAQCARNVQRAVERVVESALGDGGCKRVVCTGHSLGAAVASLLAIGLAQRYDRKKVRCWAFATPACLSPEVANSKKTRQLIYSFTNCDDVIPRATATAFVKVQRTLVHLLDTLEGIDTDSRQSAEHTSAIAARRVLRLWVLVYGTDSSGSSSLRTQLERSAGVSSIAELAPPKQLRAALENLLASVGDDEKDRRRTSEIDSLFQTLVPPGRHVLLRSGAHRAVLLARRRPLAVRLSPGMLRDHLVDAYGRSLRDAIRAQGPDHCF